MGLTLWNIIGIVFLCIFCVGVGAVIGGFYMGHKYCVELINTRNIADKNLQIINIYDMWMSLGNDCIARYLERNGIKKIAIYGFARLGQRLFYEIKRSDVSVSYAMDRNPSITIKDLEIKKPCKVEKDYMVDAVVVTPIFSFDIIKKDLENYGYNNVISLYEILYDVAQKQQDEFISTYE